MINLKILFAALATLTLVTAPLAAASCKKADSKLSGKYRLTGVMETASSIILAADGRFGYALTVGAFDEIARGCWLHKNNTIVLNPKDIRANNGQPSFKRLILRIDTNGRLVRFHDGKRMGAYTRQKK